RGNNAGVTFRVRFNGLDAPLVPPTNVLTSDPLNNRPTADELLTYLGTIPFSAVPTNPPTPNPLLGNISVIGRTIPGVGSTFTIVYNGAQFLPGPTATPINLIVTPNSINPNNTATTVNNPLAVVNFTGANIATTSVPPEITAQIQIG